VTGYILDLRSNPGGLLYSSIDIARMWLDDGTIVSTVNRQGVVDEEDGQQSSPDR
jgi:carboxyl-terminal processing protease